MIEVEQKFILSEKEIAKLTEGAEFLGEKVFTDIYYDSVDFTLTKNDMWLRRRGENWELKLPMYQANEHPTVQQYQEIEGEEKIRQVFGIAPVADFLTDIERLGYKAFCKLTTTRRKFQKENFTIDFDEVTSKDGFVYQIGEIELMVEEKAQMQAAVEKIANFASAHDLQIRHVLGKVLVYLQRKNPKHFKTLVEAGVAIPN